jgi:hypothetical protein
MKPRPGRKATGVAGFLVAVLLVSSAGLAIVEAQGATPAQLQTMIQAAESSRAYAAGLVADAASHALNVASEQSFLASGDTLLAQAKADLLSSVNLGAGIQDAQAAMQDYTGAAAGSSLELKNAGLTTSVDLAAAVDAEAEVNATASIVAKLATRACESISVISANVSLFQDSCAEAASGIANATLDLGEAAALIAQANLNASAGADISQAFSILAQAREDVNASASELATISSFTYYQRGEAYYSQVLLGPYASANSSIREQNSVFANLSAVQSSFKASVEAAAQAYGNLTELADNPAGGLLFVFNEIANGAKSTASEASSNFTSLLRIVSSLAGSAPLVSSINTAQAGTSAYSNAVVTVNSSANGFTSTSIPDFSAYLAGLDAASQSVNSTGQTFIADYSNVQVQLEALIRVLGVLAPPALLTANTTLTSLKTKVTGIPGSLDSYLAMETEEMSSFGSTVNATVVALRPESGAVVSAATVQALVAIAHEEAVYLNATSLAAVRSSASSIQSDANATAVLVTSANSSLSKTVGQFYDSIGSLLTTYILGGWANKTTSALTRAVSVVSSDLAARTSALTYAKLEVTSALSFFYSLDVSIGVSLMVAADTNFQAAAFTYS